jgi:flagellar biosynthesis/type III secretory pathway chaperone
MTDRLDALSRTLEDEARVCEGLRDVLREEQRAVVSLRAEAIFTCLAKRHELHAELAGLAARRRALAAEAGGGRTVIELLPLLPPAEHRRLEGGLRRLRRVLLETRSLERQNRALAAASLETTNEALQALRALVPGAHYGADARLEAPVALESLDRRA